MIKRLRLLKIFVLVMLVGIMMNHHSQAQTSEGPRFEFKAEEDKLVLDTMHLEFQEKVELEIEFENRGNAPLLVKKVDGCCGTRIVDWSRKPLQPGESGTIEVEFQVPPRPHKINRTVKAITNDPKGEKTLKIEGIVKEKKDGSVDLGGS